MQRDMDLIRDILLYLEALPVPPSSTYTIPLAEVANAIRHEDMRKIGHHVEMLIDSGLLVVVGRGISGHSELLFHRISWDGHDFIDAVRSPEIWSRTKAAAIHAGGWTFDLLLGIAKAFLRHDIETQTGLAL